MSAVTFDSLCNVCAPFFVEPADPSTPTTASTASRIIAIIFVFLTATVGVALRFYCPWLIRGAVVTHINVLSCGMFLSLACFHLMPESIENMPKTWPVFIDYSFLFMILGFLLIFIIERVLVGGHEHGHGHGTVKDVELQEEAQIDESLRSESLDKSIDLLVEPKKSHSSGIVLMLALSVHSLFEGAIITLSSQADIWLVLLVVCLHKWAAAFAVANQMERSKMDRKYSLTLLLIFSLTSPIGAGIGWAIGEFGQDSGAIAVFNAVAAGTLIYIAMTEILPEEFQNQPKMKRWVMLAMLLSGLTLILVLTGFHEQLESHEESEKPKVKIPGVEDDAISQLGEFCSAISESCASKLTSTTTISGQ